MYTPNELENIFKKFLKMAPGSEIKKVKKSNGKIGIEVVEKIGDESVTEFFQTGEYGYFHIL